MNVTKETSETASPKSLSISYKLRSSDAVKDKKQTTVSISIVLLDHAEVIFTVNKRDRGQVLLDLIFQHLRVSETKFFGLQFPNDVPDTMRWLDPTKSIRKQFRRGYPYILFFRIKFYATDISMIKDEFTKYQLFLQIKLDLLEKRLPCRMSVASMIASFAVQSEFGDYNHLEHENNYISGIKFLPNQTKEFEDEVLRLHKLHKGLSPDQAETHAIKKAQKLELYGVEIHHAKDAFEDDLDVGVTSTGMLFYQNKLRIHQFKWSAIVKISFKRKQFYVQLRENLQSVFNFPEMIYSFHMDNYRACKRLWKSCVDFHSFYRINRCMNNSYMHKQGVNDPASSANTETKSEKNLLGLLTLGRKQKYKETCVYSNDDSVNHQQYLRKQTGSAKSKDNLVSLNEEKLINDEKAPRRLSAPPSVSYGVGVSMFSDKEMLEILKNNAPSTTSANAKHNTNSQVALNTEEACHIGGFENYEVLPSPSAIPIVLQPPHPALTETLRVLQLRPKPVPDTNDVGSSETSLPTSSESDNSALSSQTEKSYVVTDGTSLPFPYQSSGNQINGIPEGFVLVRIRPDSDGRYGFNVKGGADQNIPVTVSKVADNSPAALCSPPLRVGDHIVQINGRDISGHSHDQVVRFIKSTREYHTSQLVLLVLPIQYKHVPDTPETFVLPTSTVKPVNRNSVVQDEGALLHSSIQWLEDMLDSGELLAMFENLYRKKPGSTMDDAKLPINVAKNRYRDISPYDNTRVRLQHGTSDYINANYVNMFIPGIEWTNSYVASQGPLLTTTVDFWSMVWELKASFIVMLTTVIERGRPKCHQYWPAKGTVIQFGPWQIESVSEEITPSFAYRDFKLYNCTNENENPPAPRNIRQMQYLAWPDHGVPDDSSDFLDFILQVRQRRVGMTNACVVHCSAGIGRTGVLITMETAMCLIEANQPVYPLEITRAMRDQRAMMIQTTSQFKFVCEAILRVYKEGLAKPIVVEDFDELDDSDQEQNSQDLNDVQGVTK